MAKALMSACDELVREMGGRDIFLHVRVKDTRATSLYIGGGYEVRERENVLARMFLSKDGEGLALYQKQL